MAKNRNKNKNKNAATFVSAAVSVDSAPVCCWKRSFFLLQSRFGCMPLMCLSCLRVVWDVAPCGRDTERIFFFFLSDTYVVIIVARVIHTVGDFAKYLVVLFYVTPLAFDPEETAHCPPSVRPSLPPSLCSVRCAWPCCVRRRVVRVVIAPQVRMELDAYTTHTARQHVLKFR